MGIQLLTDERSMSAVRMTEYGSILFLYAVPLFTASRNAISSAAEPMVTGSALKP